ncbi:glycosyltransferase family 2 protein [Candidatus Daviesbacteria bacterium]|nr:glycosyltransferase family 2 protein [Candidatus Daviesbacteria bacterium]
MTKPTVSMIVSNINGVQLNLIGACINFLIKPGYPNWELIVVDNASTDDSVKYLNKRFKNYKNCIVLENPINMYSQGLNLGAEKATGKYLAYFNNDVAITKTYLNNLVKEFEKDKKLAIAQGKLLNYTDHKKIDSAGESMDIFGNPVTIGFGEIDKGQYNHVEEILSASGSACVIRKSIFEKLGGYDPIFGIGYEDMDLALRVRRLGYKVKRFPDAVIYHKRAATDLADFIRVKVKWHFNKNRLITMLKNYPVWLLLKSLPVTILLYQLIILYEWIIRRNWNMGRVRLTSLIWVIFHLPDIIVSRNKIKKIGAKSLSEKDYALFSSKSLFSDFRQFLQT